MNHSESVSSVPYGLIACRLDGVQAHIAQLSPRSLLLRTPDFVSGQSIELIFFRIETGETISHTIPSFKTGEARRENGAVLTRFYFDDPVCAAEIRRALNSYARYVEIRSEFGASAYGETISGYPWEMDDDFYPSLPAQRRAWFSSLAPLKTNLPLATELNCPELWQLYLETPANSFPAAYAASRCLPENFFGESILAGLYVGSALCSRLNPDIPTLEAILEKARREDLSITIVTAEMRTGGESHADALLDFAVRHNLELEINDWGMLQRARPFADKIHLLLGPQLNRRRRDPRMKYKSGISGREELLAGNSLNSPIWLEYLANFGIERYEYESCGFPVSLPDAACSLHLPFYQTNTSLWCPLQALCEQGDRAAQGPSNACPEWCARNVLLYPAHLNMIGRWNSILALDTNAFFPEASQGFDRLVLNF